MHTILAIDTSTEACSVALLFKNETTFDFILSQQQHAKQILPMINHLLVDSSCSMSQIDAIAFAQGPGSFTGVRIGIGVAQGLALGIDKPMIGVSTLMTLAQAAYRTQRATHVISAIDAKMGEIYLGQYDYQDNEWQLVITESVITPNQLENTISIKEKEYYVAGSGWQTYPDLLTNLKDSNTVNHSGVILPHAQDLIVIANTKWKKREVIKVENVQPTYLRNEVAWKKLPGKQ